KRKRRRFAYASGSDAPDSTRYAAGIYSPRRFLVFQREVFVMIAPRHSWCLLAAICLGGSAASLRAAESEKWNIVSVVTDDQGAWALGCYGNKECRTPNMDRLAREG